MLPYGLIDTLALTNHSVGCQRQTVQYFAAAAFPPSVILNGVKNPFPALDCIERVGDLSLRFEMTGQQVGCRSDNLTLTAYSK